MVEYFQGKQMSKLSNGFKMIKWVSLIPALPRISLEGFKFGFDELGGNYDLPGIEAGSRSYFEVKCWPWKPLNPSMVLPTSQTSWFGAKTRALSWCLKIKPKFLTDDFCKSNMVLFLFSCRETELPLFSIICRVVVSVHRIVAWALNFLYFLGIWRARLTLTLNPA